MRLKYWILLAIGGLAILFLCNWKYKIIPLSDLISLLTMIVLAVTAGAILWYSWETRKMRNEMIKQTELSIRPQIIAYLDEKGEYFFIKNVGYGTAMNIMVDDLYLWEKPPYEIKIAFSRIDAIMPEEAKKLIHTPYTAGRKTDWNFISNLNPQWASQTYQLNITYDNIEETKYLSIVQCGKAGIRLLENKKLDK